MVLKQIKEHEQLEAKEGHHLLHYMPVVPKSLQQRELQKKRPNWAVCRHNIDPITIHSWANNINAFVFKDQNGKSAPKTLVVEMFT